MGTAIRDLWRWLRETFRKKPWAVIAVPLYGGHPTIQKFLNEGWEPFGGCTGKHAPTVLLRRRR